MFGWLESFGVQSRARSTATTRWLALSPRTLFEGLGQLGGLLYLAPRHAVAPDVVDASGCLVESAELAPLLGTRYVGVTCAVTAEGPREWIDCVNGQGDTVGRVYLLPDTDYLAWDGLFAGALPSEPPSCRTPDREWLRASRARVLCFTRRRMAGFTVLGVREAPISSLGHGVARDIAVSESVAISI
ncbi:hypothetical protein [Luteibacter yeojuensis]|uniref:Uncharacterized protein n=1 Tax=Luteibacter yeojuensis TaxID=345309 RepID=A0A7X5QU86_9GAMM|nr:hypothetical protein [Luteibacter yeojuensis]NID15535.1 hypothetical protein [Luteibacter yeojuensis]